MADEGLVEEITCLLALDTGAVVTDGDADAMPSHPQVGAAHLGERAAAGSSAG